MATKGITKLKSKGRKIGRSDRKRKGATSAISAFVRNRITGEEYFKLTNQLSKR